MEFSEKVKHVRMKRQLTRDAMAREMGIGGATLTRWEHGESRPQLALLGKFNEYCEKHGICFEEEKLAGQAKRQASPEREKGGIPRCHCRSSSHI